MEDMCQKLIDHGRIMLYLQPHMVSLKNYQDKQLIDPEDAWCVAKSVVETLDLLHENGYMAGPFTRREILLQHDPDGVTDCVHSLF